MFLFIFESHCVSKRNFINCFGNFPVLQGEYTNDLKDSDESIMIECDNLQQSSLSLPHMPRILTQPSKSSKSSALGQTENKGKENIKVLEKGKRGRPSKSDELTDDEVTEELIEEVAKEPCLYDFSLPIEQRGEKQRASAWERISRRLGGWLKIVYEIFLKKGKAEVYNFIKSDKFIICFFFYCELSCKKNVFLSLLMKSLV